MGGAGDGRPILEVAGDLVQLILLSDVCLTGETMGYRGYYRRRYRGGYSYPHIATVSNVHRSLRVPGSVYEKLKRRFLCLTPQEDKVFLAK